MPFYYKKSIDKLMYLNDKKEKSDREKVEYDLMLKNQDLEDEFVSLLVKSGGKEETKKLFWGKVELSNEKATWQTTVLFLAFLAIVYFGTKENESKS